MTPVGANTFGAEHTLLLGGDVYSLDNSNFIFGRNNAQPNSDVFNPFHPGIPTLTGCPCNSSLALTTQFTAGPAACSPS